MRASKIITVLLLAIGLMMILITCSGTGSTDETATDEIRTVTGTVPAANASINSLMTRQAAECAADTVMATDTAGETTSATVGADCSFSLTLSVGKAYVISLVLEDEFVATLLFDSGVGGFTTSTLPVGEGEEIIDLGSITISGIVATSDREPLEQNDCDGDGEDDLADDDDDNDGLDDDEEEDCDLDGHIDDVDDDDDCEEDEDREDEGRVLEVKPRNDPHPELGEDRVDLDKEVRARISCEVDRTSVSATTFRVEATGDVIACTHEFSGRGRGDTVKCHHDDDDFLADTTYTATLEGVLCTDGRTVKTTSWSFRTETEDDDEGDAEDQIDEEDEDEEENEEKDDDEDEDEDGEEEDDEEDDEDEDD